MEPCNYSSEEESICTSQKSTQVSFSSDDSMTSVDVDNHKISYPKIPWDVFHTPKDAVAALLSQSTPFFNQIPDDWKENVYFKIKNIIDIERSQGQRVIFVDDCGAWKSHQSSTPKHYYMVQDDLWKLSEGAFCFDKTINSKRVKVTLDPQPGEDCTVVSMRYYNT